MTDSHELFNSLVPEFEALEDVGMSRMFMTTGLGVRGKIFAFVGPGGALVVKLPAARVNELEADGLGQHAVLAGRAMREWASISATDFPVWHDIMHEAREFVDAITAG